MILDPTTLEQNRYIPLNPQQAVDACDALAKSIYSRMFEWIVARVNDATKAKSSLKKRNQKFIGVLDIFGFEIFENNSFEQLCINYANEKLQQFFNKHTFKEEESVYVSEQVPYTKINFIDNQPVLNLIERKRKGILPILDDEVRMPKGSDEGFMKRVDKENGSRKAYKKSSDLRNRYKKNTYFKVQHYAGDVVYAVFEREAREFQSNHSIFVVTRISLKTHKTHVYHSFVAQENCSNTNAQTHTQMLRKT